MSGLFNGVNAVGLEPTEFSIGQNYPNPFKDKTVIKYCVAYKSRVQITVYNSEGIVIEKLVDEEKNPGTYEVEFNTSSRHTDESRKLDQGYYFYRMRAGDYTSEKKWLCINKLSGRLNMKSFLQTLFCFLLVSQICFAQWVQIGLEDKTIQDITARNSNIFAITSDSRSVYRSTDNGSNWTAIVDTDAVDIAIAPSGTIFMLKKVPFYGILWNRLFSSSDNGDTWDTLTVQEQILPPPWSRMPILTNVSVSHTGIVYCGISIGCGEREECTFFASSADDGTTWTTPGQDIRGGQLFDYKGGSVISAGFASLSGEYLYLSTDNGLSWTFLGYAPTYVYYSHILSLCLNGNILLGGMPILGYGGGLFLSTDFCTTWTKVSTIFPKAGLSILTGGTMVGTDSLGVFLFSDNGDSLGSRNDGLANLNIHSLTIDNNNYVYAGTDNGVWRRPLSEIVPVELTSFIATTNGKEVILNWSTATELNNLGFEIQRSEDNVSFNKVGFVPGFGTTTEPKNYSYTDQSAKTGINHYRLKQVDCDGSYEYSDVVEVDYSVFNSYLLEQNYPNPFNPTTSIHYAVSSRQFVNITVYDLLGREIETLVNEEKPAGTYEVTLYAEQLPSGVYFYQLKAGEFVETKKMILMK